jgi:hypothetical protein
LSNAGVHLFKILWSTDNGIKLFSHALAEQVGATVSKEEQSGNRFNQLPGW